MGNTGSVQQDGLWVVIHEPPDPRRMFVAAYVIEHGRVKWCAPILRRCFDYWRTKARYLGP